MSVRSTRVPDFLTSLSEAFAAAGTGPASAAALSRIFDALRIPGPAGDRPAARRPVCAQIDAALEHARAASVPLARLADTFAALEPALAWAPRPVGGPSASENWFDGHANATIVGPAGLEDRRDLSIGVSLLAPHVRYPDHRHGPEEVYLLLSPGRFRNGDSDWFDPGTGGTLYNPPNVLHAMASDAAPLLAFWCLWMAKPS